MPHRRGIFWVGFLVGLNFEPPEAKYNQKEGIETRALFNQKNIGSSAKLPTVI
jgi:hypothetical protein